MTLLAKPPVALGFGAFFICVEACNHFDILRALPANWLSLPLYDWAAGVFLIYGAVLSRRDWASGRPYQIAAWAFITSLLSRAFLEHFQDWVSPAPEDTGSTGLVPISAGPYLVIVGILFLVSLSGLIASLTTTRDIST